MPIRSMTGFGQAESRTALGNFRVEIRSVNNRYFELQLRVPKAISMLEPKIKQFITSKVSRGSVSVFITGDKDNDNAKLSWNKPAVKTYIDIFREIKKEFKLEGDVTLRDLLGFSDVIKTESTAVDDAAFWKVLQPAISTAIDDFQQSRVVEAEALLAEFKRNIKIIAKSLAAIEKEAPRRQKKYIEQLKVRIKLLADTEPDATRIATEIAILADRLDIAEECVRLKTHIEAFLSVFESDEPVGKRMNFLLQEMQREATTIGSKANDTTIGHEAITLKEQIEKIREQALNLE